MKSQKQKQRALNNNITTINNIYQNTNQKNKTKTKQKQNNTNKNSFKIRHTPKHVMEFQTTQKKTRSKMATFEQIKAMFEMHEKKNDTRLDQLERNIEKKVRETMTEEVVKNVIDSLAPRITKEVEKEVNKVIEPLKKQLEKTESQVFDLKKVLENLNTKLKKQGR